MKKIIDPEEARAVFNYDQKTGILTNRFSCYGPGKGREVGTIKKSGTKTSVRLYRRLLMNGKMFYAHRVIWVMMTGKQPDDIDHIDGNGLNNKWKNLRNGSHAKNGWNQKIHTTNTSGTSGVTYRKDNGKWRARIMINDKMINLGTFVNKQDAINSRKQAEETMWR